MTAHGFSLASAIILLFPMLYFLFASISFLLVKLSDPTVTWLMRGLFNSYFLAVAGCCGLGILAFLSAGRPPVAAGLCLVAAVAIGARRWFLRQLDAHIRARDTGDARAVDRLRRLHLGGMLYNAVQIAVVVACVPVVFGAA